MKISPRYGYAILSTTVAALIFGVLVGRHRLPGGWLAFGMSLVAVFFLARHLYGKID
jgi:uncharacterized membrane protein AbrB (regulator of aidB expression)